MLKKDFDLKPAKNFDGSWVQGFTQNQENKIVMEGGKPVLRVKYPKGRIGPGVWGKPETYNALNAVTVLDTPNTEDPEHPFTYTLEYYVKFENVFDYKLGGKLPGLAGGLMPSGGRLIGDKYMEGGFTARFMWHMMGEGYSIPSIIEYIYHPGREGEIGKKIYGAGSTLGTPPRVDLNDRSLEGMLELKKDTWYKITQQIKPNTPNASDGTLKVWINGTLMSDMNNMKFIADGKHGQYTVDRFFFSTFYGRGNVEQDALNYDTYARFKDICVYVK